MSLTFVIGTLVAVLGIGAAAYFQLRALAHLKAPSVTNKIIAVLLGPFGGSLYEVEGLRFRMLAVIVGLSGVTLGMLILFVGEP